MMRDPDTGCQCPLYLLERCQICGDMVEDRGWDGQLGLWVGECCTTALEMEFVVEEKKAA